MQVKKKYQSKYINAFDLFTAKKPNFQNFLTFLIYVGVIFYQYPLSIIMFIKNNSFVTFTRLKEKLIGYFPLIEGGYDLQYRSSSFLKKNL